MRTADICQIIIIFIKLISHETGIGDRCNVVHKVVQHMMAIKGLKLAHLSVKVLHCMTHSSCGTSVGKCVTMTDVDTAMISDRLILFTAIAGPQAFGLGSCSRAINLYTFGSCSRAIKARPRLCH